MVLAYNEKQQEDYKNRIIQAYYTAGLQRTKRMPEIAKLLKDIEPKKDMTDEDMLAVVKQLQASFKG